MPILKTIEASSADLAMKQLAEQYRTQVSELKLVSSESRKHTFEIYKCPAIVDIEISRDGMKATLKRLEAPVGDGFPAFNIGFLLEQLKNLKIVSGVKRDVLTAELMKAMKSPSQKPVPVVVAEGAAAVPGTVGKPKVSIDLKVFEKPDPVFIKKGDIIAVAPEVSAPRDGYKVTGEVLEASLQEQQKLQVGGGIKTVRKGNELHYIADFTGRLFYDQGIRLRIDPKPIVLEEGMVVLLEIGKSTIGGTPFNSEILIEWATSQNVKHGMLPKERIETQLKEVKKWPAKIIVARGTQPQDGKTGAVLWDYKDSKILKALDPDRLKQGIVFPGECVLRISPPSDPVNGMTPFGELLRAKPYTDLPIYPGKNISREKVGDDIQFKSLVYGKVVKDGDRVHVQHTLKVSEDKMKVFVDLFPDRLLSHVDILPLLREADILILPEKDDLDNRLKLAFDASKRNQEFVLVEGRPPMLGRDAKLVYRFDPAPFRDKGLFQKKEDPLVLAAPGDLLLTKMEPMEAQPGFNIYREKIPVAASNLPKDVKVNYGKGIEAKLLGKDTDPNDPPRTEFRSARFGLVEWKDLNLDIRSLVEVDKEEKLAMISLAPKTDFGTPLTMDLLKKVAEVEGIRVNISEKILADALKQPRAPDRSLRRTVLAEAIPVVHGKDAAVEYLVDFNNEKIEEFLGDSKAAPDLVAADCVRAGDVLAVKTAATLGEDGKTIFGKRIAADRGRDEPWFIGEGVNKSPDGLQIVSGLKGAAYVFVQNGKLVVKPTVKVAADKMSATVTLYPTKNPRFQLREDKIHSMLEGVGVKFGIKKDFLRTMIQEAIEAQEPRENILVAEGQPPKRGAEAAYVFAIGIGESVGEERADGSIDFKNRHVFQNVVKGQVLMIRRPPTAGEDGRNVFGDLVNAVSGGDSKITVLEGVESASNGIEFRAKIDGIVEFRNRSIRVIPGLLLSSDVNFKTGHVQAGSADVFIKGGVLPDFFVRSEGRITIEKVAEACIVEGRRDVRIKGGIIGKDRGRVFSGSILETHYISNGATVEAMEDIKVETEILNSHVRSAGKIECLEGAGAIVGGEIWAFKGIKAKVVGSVGSEQPTMIHLGENYFARQEALKKIDELQLDQKILDIQNGIRNLSKDLSLILTEREAAGGHAAELQERYQKALEEKRSLEAQLIEVEKTKQEILGLVPFNDLATVVVQDMIHAGVTIRFKEVTWTLKGDLKSVEIYYDKVTNNLVSKRL